jgi:hypothetical protein
VGLNTPPFRAGRFIAGTLYAEMSDDGPWEEPAAMYDVLENRVSKDRTRNRNSTIINHGGDAIKAQGSQFNIPQKKYAPDNYGNYRNKDRIRLQSSAQYGLSIFWKEVDIVKPKK